MNLFTKLFRKQLHSQEDYYGGILKKGLFYSRLFERNFGKELDDFNRISEIGDADYNGVYFGTYPISMKGLLGVDVPLQKQDMFVTYDVETLQKMQDDLTKEYEQRIPHTHNLWKKFKRDMWVHGWMQTIWDALCFIPRIAIAALICYLISRLSALLGLSYYLAIPFIIAAIIFFIWDFYINVIQVHTAQMLGSSNKFKKNAITQFFTQGFQDVKKPPNQNFYMRGKYRFPADKEVYLHAMFPCDSYSHIERVFYNKRMGALEVSKWAARGDKMRVVHIAGLCLLFIEHTDPETHIVQTIVGEYNMLHMHVLPYRVPAPLYMFDLVNGVVYRNEHHNADPNQPVGHMYETFPYHKLGEAQGWLTSSTSHLFF